MDTERIATTLSRADAYPTRPATLTRLETHISVFFFAGDRVYKLQKPVDLGFLDFTTIERRRRFCDEEVRLNRRLAPSVYLGVRPVTVNDAGEVRIDGCGEVIDHVVEMVCLPLDQMIDRKLDRGEIDNQAINELAELLAGFHGGAETGPLVDRFGTPDAVAEVVLENLHQLATWTVPGENTEQGPCRLPPVLLDFLRERMEIFLGKHRELLLRRVATGRIRNGHGDLQSANI